MSQSRNLQNIGIGQTAELNQRVSVATQMSVTFPHPDTGEQILALEHRGTVITADNQIQVEVMVQPFGGAMRILTPDKLLRRIGKFHFDSPRSRDEQDFRIFIRPDSWEEVKNFCLENFIQPTGSALETDPTRELIEEFEDTMGILPKPEQYIAKPVGTILENKPSPTRNIHAPGAPTVRLYRIHEIKIIDPELCRAILTNSKAHSAEILRKLAMEDFEKGEKGRSNAMFTVSMELIREAYQGLPYGERDKPFPFMNVTFDRNVPAILDNVPAPAYKLI